MGPILLRAVLLPASLALAASLAAADGLGPDGAALFLDFAGRTETPAGLRLHRLKPPAEGLEFTEPLQYAELDDDAMARFARAIDGAPALTIGGWFLPRRAGEGCFLSRGVPRS